MSDLRDRFHELDDQPAPDLWREIEMKASAAPGARSSMSGWTAVVATSVLAAVLVGAALIGGGILKVPDRSAGPPAWSGVPLATADTTNSSGPTATATPTRAENDSAVWIATSSMVSPRAGGQTATLLRDGRVLVAGGTTCWMAEGGPIEGACRVLASAELYDPADGTWVATGAMTEPRFFHTATLLPDGTVLVAGGDSGGATSPALASAELYDPVRGTWAATGAMIQSREGQTATLLPNGKVLVTGGDSPDFPATAGHFSQHPQASAELYDPATGRWTATGSMARPGGGTATLLADGHVLVASDVPERYDPATGIWTATGAMTEAFSEHAAALLLNGTVLFAGGDAGSAPGPNPSSHAALYDPVTGAWTAAAAMITPRLSPTATLLADGCVLVVGGRVDGGHESAVIAEAELYDPVSGTWTPTARMLEGRSGHTATLLPDGRVLVAGGEAIQAGSGSASAELYVPGLGT